MYTQLPDRWAALAGETVLRSLVLFALTGLTALILRRASAAAHALLWRLALAALLALPVLTVVLPPLPVPALDRVHPGRTMLAAPPADVRRSTDPAVSDHEIITPPSPIVATLQPVLTLHSASTLPIAPPSPKRPSSFGSGRTSIFTHNLPLPLF